MSKDRTDEMTLAEFIQSDLFTECLNAEIKEVLKNEHRAGTALKRVIKNTNGLDLKIIQSEYTKIIDKESQVSSTERTIINAIGGRAYQVAFRRAHSLQTKKSIFKKWKSKN